MSEISQQEIVKQLTENTADIIEAGADAKPEALTALSHRQKSLTEVLKKLPPGDVSQAVLKDLHDLVKKAIDMVSAEMASNRDSMLVTGFKKKVLSAYGTVTVSGTPPK